MAKTRVLPILPVFILLLGCISNPFSGIDDGTVSMGDCSSMPGSLEKDECMAKMARETVRKDRVRAEQYCVEVKDSLLRDSCNYDIVQEKLIQFYSNEQGKDAFNPLREDLKLICGRIERKTLKSTCIERLSRPHLFRYLRGNSTA